MRRMVILTAMAVLAGCGKSETMTERSKATSPVEITAPKSTDSVGQAYSITTTGAVPKLDLPPTNTMKLMGFDAAAYIQRACIDTWRVSRCDVYAQPEARGTLLGYVTISVSPTGASFETDTITTPLGTTSKECVFSGVIEGDNLDVGKDFRARSQFETTDGAIGMIYLERVGNNLHMSDERWNYCYDERHVGDVYYLVGSFARNIDKSKWPATPGS